MTRVTKLDRRMRDELLGFAEEPGKLAVRAVAGVIASGREGRIPALEEGLGVRRFTALVERLFPADLDGVERRLRARRRWG